MNINEQRLVDEFFELVQTDSASKNERKIADVLKTKLQSMHFSVTEDDAGPKIGGNTGNIIAILEGELDSPPLLLSAHMDRVEPGSNIKPHIEDGIIKSDGSTILAADDVAGICAILEAVRIIQENNIPHGRLEVLFTVAEEGGLFGVKALDAKAITAKAGYCLDAEGPVGTIVVQAPSHKTLKVTVRGRASHAGVAPEKGINAIVVAAEAITKMKLGRIDEETTANVGIIEGGSGTNVIPDTVVFHGEARSLDHAKLESQVKQMLEAVRTSCAKYGATADLEEETGYTGFKLSSDDYVVQLACKAAEAMGLKPSVESTGGGSDANVLNDLDIPTVVLGVGYSHVHSTSESMPVEQLIKAAEYVVSLITNNA